MTDEKKTVVSIDIDLEDLIPGFLENRKADVDKLKSALANKEFKNIQSLGHSLKGVGGGYGFDEITRIGAEIETAAKTGSEDEIGQLIDEMGAYLGNIEIRYE